MQQNFNIAELLDNQVVFLAGSISCIIQSTPLPPFAEEVIEWLNALSSALLKDPQSRRYPDVVTFAFFCRKANIMKQKKQFLLSESSTPFRLGRGLVFHIAPSNVPVNFAYSLVAGLLAGNTNVVRVSQKPFPQVDIIVRHIQALQDFNSIGSRIAIVRYPHESNANKLFSALCAVRVIWGGDNTIAQIRQNPLQPRAFDICFADRYSLAAISTESVITASAEEMKRLAERFYNDTYLFDQNACSAPHLIVWIGNNTEEAKSKFWKVVYEETRKKYEFQDKMAVDKLTALYRQAAAMPIKDETSEDNLLKRVKLQSLISTIDEYRCACGYFSEYEANTIDCIADIASEKYQTLAYYGLTKEQLNNFVANNILHGIDRIVPIGETTTFSLVWDGINLIERLSRIIDMQ